MVSGGGANSGGSLPYLESTSDFTRTDTVESGKSGNHIIRISPNATVDAIVYYQLEKGSVAHDFEPYTGGKPSPSPEYPQKIENIVNPNLILYTNLYNKDSDVIGEYYLEGIGFNYNELWNHSEYINILPNRDICLS